MYTKECAWAILGSRMGLKGCIFVCKDHKIFTVVLKVDSWYATDSPTSLKSEDLAISRAASIQCLV